MGVGNRVARAMDRMYDRMRHPATFGIRPEDAVTGTFDGLRGNKYALLVTFRRSGEPVPSPVWFAVDAGGRLYVQTGKATGKVKRIGNDPRVLACPSTVRGRPRGPVVAGRARVLPKEEWSHAEATMAAAYGLGRRLYTRFFPMSDEVQAYLEVVPADPD